MRNVTETWRRMTGTLHMIDMLILGLLIVPIVANTITWMVEPSWGNAGDILVSTVVLACLWRWSWLEGYQRMFAGLTAMGHNIGKNLHEYGDLLISKHGKEYRVTPLTVDRDT